MKITSLHGDGRPHRTWLRAEVTDDPWAFFIPPGSPVMEADGRCWSDSDPVLLLFWPGEFYQACLLMRDAGTDYYCNVITPPVYDPQAGVRFHDLDIDVLRMQGVLKVADEDEFQVRSSLYPSTWVAAALAARDRLVEAAYAQSGPFSPSLAHRWRAWLKRRG
ncbi:MAG: DUF402 domain-containing protein [Alicyclobacillus herbarius]|uniref:DUF402 domain-containing protein n=1 Tax=Alicyclobacillus herbarius TaxID=122960 RepID=UPI0004253FA9|nr:DUF402 domain-containing protein [Alicyclobacillus herbarius]MCL6631356.1 DUF402 domain-containing protein [Alicyclobacillus herbarius]